MQTKQTCDLSLSCPCLELLLVPSGQGPGTPLSFMHIWGAAMTKVVMIKASHMSNPTGARHFMLTDQILACIEKVHT